MRRCHSDGDANCHAHTDGDANCHANTDGNAYRHSYVHGHGNGDANTDANGDGYSYGHVYTYGHGDSHYHTYCNAYARGQTDADAQAASSSSSAGGALIGPVKAGTREQNLASSPCSGSSSPQDDVKCIGEVARMIRRRSRILLRNALRTTRSTVVLDFENSVDTLLRIQLKGGTRLRRVESINRWIGNPMLTL